MKPLEAAETKGFLARLKLLILKHSDLGRWIANYGYSTMFGNANEPGMVKDYP